MGGLFGGGGGGGKKRNPTEQAGTTGFTVNGDPYTPPTSGVANTGVRPPEQPPMTLAVDNTSASTEARRRRMPSFLVTPTMMDDGGWTGRSETFG